MGLFSKLLGRPTRQATRAPRRTGLEQLEDRRLMAADVLLGSVYLEDSTSGNDNAPDVIRVSFVGGAAGTTLDRLVIDGDKTLNGPTNSDIFFDTVKGGQGAFEAVGYSPVSTDGFTVTSVSVVDGGTQIIFEFDGFDAGEEFVFSIDVDEYGETLAGLNSNAFAEGGEFEGSIMTGHFSAPGFVDLSLQGLYWDYFDPNFTDAENATGGQLTKLPGDNYDNPSDPLTPVRTAGAVAHAPQVELARISGYVYHDQSDDGIKDPSESPISNVTLELLDGSGVGTGIFTTTNDAGYYEFIGLEAGTYGVRETQPGGWLDGKDTAGSHLGTAGNDIITGAVLNWGDRAVNYNFGELLPGSIEGHVGGNNGPDCKFDDPDTLIEGVTIQLLDAAGNVLRTTLTDAQGHYRFDNLAPGEYQVRELQPEGWYDGGERVGTAGGTATDDLFSGIVIGSDQHAVDYDFCEHIGAMLSGYVYHDRDNDGSRDPGEEPIPQVTLKLLRADGTDTGQRAVTDSNGFYKFNNLDAGTYCVMEIHPSGWVDGLDTAGTKGGDATNPGDMICEITIDYGDDAREYNFGELLPGSIAGRVGGNYGPDCKFDDPDVFISGVTIQLLDAQGNLLRTTQTNELGEYRFDNLAPGEYQVRELQPEGWFDGGERVGSAGGFTGGYTVTSGYQVSGVLDINSEVSTSAQVLESAMLFDGAAGSPGQVASASTRLVDVLVVDGNKYEKLFAEGVLYITPQVGGTTLGTAGLIVDSQTTVQELLDFIRDSTGLVSQSNVADTPMPIGGGFIYVTEGVIDLGSNFGIANAVSLPTGSFQLLRSGSSVPEVVDLEFAVKSSATGSGAVTTAVLHNAAGKPVEVLLTFTFEKATDYSTTFRWIATAIGDTDPHSGNVEGAVEVEVGNGILVFDSAGDLVANIPGWYSIDPSLGESGSIELDFSGLHLGSASSELVVTRKQDESSDANNDLIWSIHLGSEQDAVNYDFCEHVGAQLSGYVYHDRDDDGVRDPGEEPIPSVTIKLLLEDGTDTGLRATTNSLGFYRFTGLDAGKYRVMEVHPAGWVDGKDTPGTEGGVADNPGDMIREVMLDYGDDAREYNFGEILLSSIAGSVHSSPTGDCDDPDMTSPIADVVIELLDESGAVIATTTTNADGEYYFGGLRPGVYSVREQQPIDYFDSGEHLGSEGGLVSDDLFSQVVLGSGVDAVEYDFCEIPPAALSGYVFVDGESILSSDGSLPDNIHNLRDGLRTADDTPIGGVTVRLVNGTSGQPFWRIPAGGSSDDVPDGYAGIEVLAGYYEDGVFETVTDADGYYEFLGLPTGSYAVVEVHPSGYIDSLDTAGSNGGKPINPPAPGEIPVLVPMGALYGEDVIYQIYLNPGDFSVENNFSEVTTYRGWIPPEYPEPPTPPYTPPTPITAGRPPYLGPLGVPERPGEDIYGGSSQAIGYTWHLSVINAGQPREVIGESNPMQYASQSRDDLWRGAQRNESQLQQAKWRLLASDVEGADLSELLFGSEDAIPVAGDWDGDGVTDVGVFIEGDWYLDLDGDGRWGVGDLWAQLGSRDDLPVTGDWDGDGKTDIGIYGPAWPRDPHAIEREPGMPDYANHPGPHGEKAKNVPPTHDDATSGARLLAKLRDKIRGRRADLIDHVFHYGSPGDAPVAGDWNGDGVRTIGVFRDGSWDLDTNGDGRLTDEDRAVQLGQAGDLPLVGDFDGDGIDDLGVYRHGRWLVDADGDGVLEEMQNAATDQALAADGDGKPVVGDWDGDGRDEPAVVTPTDGADTVRVSLRKAG